MTRHPIAARFLRIHLGQYLGATNRGEWWAPTQRSAQQLGSEAAQIDDTLRGQLEALGYEVHDNDAN